ncbi:MAG: PorV/PorQ family protein [Elusimicrobiota bacterium]
MNNLIKNNKRTVIYCLSVYMKYLFFFVIFLILLSPTHCFGANTKNTVFNFLNIGKGARPCAMGEAFTALPDDADSVYWNPAGLVNVNKRQITASYLKYITDINSGYLAAILPTDLGHLGLGAVYLDYGTIQESTVDDPLGDNSNSYRPVDAALICSYGLRFSDKFSLGISAKGVYEKIKKYTATGVAIDLGAIYKTKVENLKVALKAENIGKQTEPFIEETHELPFRIKLGFGYTTPSDKLRIGYDFYTPGDNDINFNIGSEYTIKDIIFLRGGYKSQGFKSDNDSNILRGLSCGLGIKINKYTLDYAFIPYNNLGNVHRISFSMILGD